MALKPDDPFSSPDILLPHLGQDFDPSADLLAHKPVPPLVLPRTLHLQISPLENLLQFVNVVTLEVRDYALLQRLVLQKKNVHVNATVNRRELAETQISRPSRSYMVQSSIFKRFNRRKERSLVTKMASAANAWAAIIISKFPIGIPPNSRAARKSA